MPEAVLPPPAHPTMRHVFVYGTLRRGGDNDITRLMPVPRFVGPAMVSGHMYDLGTYPGVILAEEGAATDVVGEVYAIEPELERVLDEIEELYPQQRDEYFKRHISVQAGGLGLTCIVYEINPTYVTGKPLIASGDWLLGRC